MPLVGYVCPQGSEEPGRRNAIETCLGACSNPCVAPPLLAAMYKADTGNYHQGSYISSSMLAGSNCARQTQFERFQDFYDLPRKRYWAFRGTMAHKCCEESGDLLVQHGWLQELTTSVDLTYPEPRPVFRTETRVLEYEEYARLQEREHFRALFEVEEYFAEQKLARAEHGELFDTLLGATERQLPHVEERRVFTGDYDSTQDLVVTVRGTADGYNPIRGVLADMKSMADAKSDMVIRGAKAGTFSKNLEDSWVWQFNIYRWLLGRTAITEEHRDHFARIGHPIHPKKKTFPAPTKLWMQGIGMMDAVRSGIVYPITQRGQTTLFEIDNIPIISMQEIEDFVRPRARRWYGYLVLGEQAPIVGESQKWMCPGCAFNGDLIEGAPCRPKAERSALQAAAA